MNFSIEAGTICSYGKMLAAEERSAGTIENICGMSGPLPHGLADGR